MKKILMLAVAAVMATMSASAQYEPGKWSVDIKVGLGASWINNTEKLNLNGFELDKQVQPSVMFQAGTSYQLNKFLSLSAGLNFMMQGQAWKNLEVSNTKYQSNALELTYIQIPVMAHVYVFKGLSIDAGIQPGFLVNADMTCYIESKTAAGRKMTNYQRVDYMDDLKKFDLNVPLGISYEFNNHLVLGAQYNLGLSKVNKDEFSNKSMKNGAVLITLGYKIGL